VSETPIARTDVTYDVAVLGGHVASALLAAVLARAGVKVLLLDAGPAGHVPAGEGTVPYGAEIFALLADRFALPEIAGFGHAVKLPREVREVSGLKKNIAFLHHEERREQDPRHVVQFVVPGEHNEWHLYRPAADEHAWRIAVSAGAATADDRPRLTGAAVGEDDVTLTTGDGRTYHAEFVVDGAGPGSPLARSLLGDDPGVPLRGRSRVIAGHMHGVAPFENVSGVRKYRKAAPWSEGTTSHVFPGGWLQVIPFGNHPDSTNRRTSVTLSLDPGRFPSSGLTPEKEFAAFVERFPGLARQLADASFTGDVTAVDSWQWRASRTLFDRVFLFERSASRNDMFLGRDLVMGAELINALAPALIEAASAGDWDHPGLRRAARFQDDSIDWGDRMLEAARAACATFDLWNAYSRVWLLYQVIAAMSLKQARTAAAASEGAARWAPVERFAEAPFWYATPHGLRELLDDDFDLCVRTVAGAIAPADAADRVFHSLREADFVPPNYGFANPRDRFYRFTVARRVRTLLWTKTVAPRQFRRAITRENMMAKHRPV
jgi:tetracycline 7-halogenase / FADH2 O2-dependent halogenase